MINTRCILCQLLTNRLINDYKKAINYSNKPDEHESYLSKVFSIMNSGKTKQYKDIDWASIESLICEYTSLLNLGCDKLPKLPTSRIEDILKKASFLWERRSLFGYDIRPKEEVPQLVYLSEKAGSVKVREEGFPEMKDEDDQGSLTVSFLGATHSGKSFLISELLRQWKPDGAYANKGPCVAPPTKEEAAGGGTRYNN